MERLNYSLPELPYGYKDLIPYISEEQLRIHHQKHHQSYVNAANLLFEKLEKARLEEHSFFSNLHSASPRSVEGGIDLDSKATLKELSFQAGGHVLHSLFWQNLSPVPKGVREPKGKISEAINREFGSLERFKKEFSQAALSVEGSGWAALTFDKESQRLLIMQIEKHNFNIYPTFSILMVLDVFEHAYYIDYKNERAKFIEAFWNIVNWDEANARFENI
ncbi:MAG: superoxide dismutase [bacterium]|nr:superoxide dismutase [bacterium]